MRSVCVAHFVLWCSSIAAVAQVKLDLVELKRYIKRYVKLDICAELELRKTTDSEALKW
jgi:hypothetical protein